MKTFLSIAISLLLAMSLCAQVVEQNQRQLYFAALAQTVVNGTSEEKRDALFAIKKIQTAEASRLAIPAFTDVDEMVRATAAGTAVFLQNSESTPLLLNLLTDKAEFVRREAAFALGKSGDVAAVSFLIQTAADDKILEVRNASIIALGDVGDVSAVDFLTSILKKSVKDADELKRRSAARSIGQIAQKSASGSSATVTPQNFLAPKYKNLTIPDELSRANFSSAVGVLVRTLISKKEAPDTRREAAFALGTIGNATALSALRSNQNSDDPYLAEICREAILKIEETSH